LSFHGFLQSLQSNARPRLPRSVSFPIDYLFNYSYISFKCEIALFTL
jgi:hypothetical protein